MEMLDSVVAGGFKGACRSTVPVLREGASVSIWRSTLMAVLFTLMAVSCSEGSGVRRFEGASDCSVDVTAELNHYIATSPDGGVVTLKPGACHRIDGTVIVENKRNLTFEGNDVTLKAGSQGDGTRKHFDVRGGGGFVFRNLTLIGAHPDGGPDGYVRELEGQHGFNFGGVDGADISNVTISDVYGDFMRFAKSPAAAGEWTRNVVVNRSRFERSGRQGMHFAAASNIRVEGNSFYGVARSVFDIEPNSSAGGARNVELVDNTLTNWGNLVLPIGGKGEVSDISLIGNRLFGRRLEVLVKDPREAQKTDGGGVRRSNISIIGNVSDTASAQPGLVLHGVDGAIVRNNVQPYEPQSESVAVRMTESCDVEISENVFDGARTVLEQDGYPCP